MAWRGGGFEFPDYVSVATRRDRARAAADKLARKYKRVLAPVGPLDGNKLVRNFWGKAWCDNLESYGDYANRLPRGRSYVRHGAVIDLQIAAGSIAALISGTSIYEVGVTIRSLAPKSWTQIAAECTGQIDSFVDLLRGKLSAQVMEIVTRKDGGLFPAPKHITFKCSCPDWAGLCKHVAATLYGVGVRLDDKPELLFDLRGVNHADLVGGAAAVVPQLTKRAKGSKAQTKHKVIEGADLSALFGIDLESPATGGLSPQPAAGRTKTGRRRKSRAPV